MNPSRYRRLAVAALGLTFLATGCTSGGKPSSVAGSVEPTTMPPSAVAETTTYNTVGLRADQLMLSADGLGAVTFGTQAAVAMNRLTQALGQAEQVTAVPASAADCGATRIFRWKNFAVLINEVSARSGGKPGLVGWRLGDPASGALDMRTDKGISVGSTAGAVKAAYGPGVTFGTGDHGPTVQIPGANGAITGELDGRGDTSKIRTIQAGTVCGM